MFHSPLTGISTAWLTCPTVPALVLVAIRVGEDVYRLATMITVAMVMVAEGTVDYGNTFMNRRKVISLSVNV